MLAVQHTSLLGMLKWWIGTEIETDVNTEVGMDMDMDASADVFNMYGCGFKLFNNNFIAVV